jgi:hypothetical protein
MAAVDHGDPLARTALAQRLAHLRSVALADSFAGCDKAYAEMTDAAGTPIVKFDAGGEGARVPVQMPRLTVPAFHAQHAFEHYGSIVTYMRLKGVVPPSSAPPARQL